MDYVHYITYTLCGGWFGKEGLRVEMEGRKDGQLGGKTRTTLTHQDKSVTIATLKRPTGSRIRRVETQRKKGCEEDVGECNTAYRVPTSPALMIRAG